MRVNTTAEKRLTTHLLLLWEDFLSFFSPLFICSSYYSVLVSHLGSMTLCMLFMHLHFYAFATQSRVSTVLEQDTQSSKPEECLLQLGQLLCRCITEKIIPLREWKCRSSEGLGRGDCACERRSLILHKIISSSINYPAHRSRWGAIILIIETLASLRRATLYEMSYLWHTIYISFWMWATFWWRIPAFLDYKEPYCSQTSQSQTHRQKDR